MKVLIFGGSGFIGKNVTERFLEDKKTKVISVGSSDCNLLDLDEVVTFLNKHKPKVVINCAFSGVSANIPFSWDYVSVNTKMIVNILLASRRKGIKKIIHLGSGAEYGDSKNPISEEAKVEPKKIYGTAKAVSTLCALQVARENHLPLIVLRPFYLYGPHDDKSVVGRLIKTISENKSATLTRGEHVRDYMYIKDLATVIYSISVFPEKTKNLEIYNVGSGVGIQLKSMFRLIFKSFGKEAKYKFRAYQESENFHQIANISKIKKAIGNIKITSIKEGLAETLRASN